MKYKAPMVITLAIVAVIGLVVLAQQGQQQGYGTLTPSLQILMSL